MKYKKLAIRHYSHLVFGNAPHPVTTSRGLVFGSGIVYPEVNFTLPPMHINSETLPSIRSQYRNIAMDILNRGLELESPGIVLEFEALLEMTKYPDIGVVILEEMEQVCQDFYDKHGLKSVIRLTPNDLREFERPPRMRAGPLLETMLEFFDRGAKKGGDLLSIESTGGKEISDDALMMCDIKQEFFALTVLGVRDMKMLWKHIVGIARKHNRIAGGDTACGFANTAMVLAEKKFIPKIFATMVRIISVVRTIVAHEEGATGPDKDCGYEGPFLKAITGIPISMEGKTAACAHTSPMGNIAAACADLWSNESIQNIKLLSGMAPTVSYEQLEYDTRLMNRSIQNGKEYISMLQKLFVDSDVYLDPQAFILSPENVIDISAEMIKGNGYIESAKRGCLKALDLIEQAVKSGQLKMEEREIPWINSLQEDINSIPGDESHLIDQVLPSLEPGKFMLKEYGL